MCSQEAQFRRCAISDHGKKSCIDSYNEEDKEAERTHAQLVRRWRRLEVVATAVHLWAKSVHIPSISNCSHVRFLLLSDWTGDQDLFRFKYKILAHIFDFEYIWIRPYSAQKSVHMIMRPYNFSA